MCKDMVSSEIMSKDVMSKDLMSADVTIKGFGSVLVVAPQTHHPPPFKSVQKSDKGGPILRVE